MKKEKFFKIYSELKLYLFSTILVFFVVFPIFLPVRFEISQSMIWGASVLVIWLISVVITLLIHVLRKDDKQLEFLQYFSVISDCVFLAIVLAIFSDINSLYFFAFGIIIIGSAFYLNLYIVLTAGISSILVLIVGFSLEADKPISGVAVLNLVLEILFISIITYLVYLLTSSIKEIYFQKQKLKKTSQINKELLINTSNNLRAPLPTIRDSTQLLLDEKTGALKQDQKKMLQMIHHLSEKMIDEANSAIYFEQLKNNNLNIKIERFDLVEILNQVIDRHNIDLESSGIVLNCYQCNQPRFVEADKSKTIHIISTLIKNALAFGKSGNEITIRPNLSPNKEFINLLITYRKIEIPEIDFHDIMSKNKIDLTYKVDIYVAEEILKRMKGSLNVNHSLKEKNWYFTLVFRNS